EHDFAHRVLPSTERHQVHAGMPSDQSRIGNREDWWRVDQNQIVPGRNLGDECLEPRTADQLRRIGGNLSRRDEVEVRLRRLAGRIRDRELPADDLRDAASALATDVLVEVAAPQIAVDEKYAL